MTSPDRGLRRRLFSIYGVLLAANLGAWAWALLLFRDQPLLLGTALLAYGFGLLEIVWFAGLGIVMLRTASRAADPARRAASLEQALSPPSYEGAPAES